MCVVGGRTCRIADIISTLDRGQALSPKNSSRTSLARTIVASTALR